MKGLSAIILAIITTIFCLNVIYLPRIGNEESPPNQHVTPHYIENSYRDTGSPNIVTGVLADYRGFDTLWETSVMFVAGMTGVLLLDANKLPKNKNGKGGRL